MLKYILILYFMFVLLGPCQNKTLSLPSYIIVGGHETQIEEHPYQVSLQYNGYHICGGAIIGDSFVLTTAVCTYGFDTADLSIRAGTSLFGEGGTVIKIDKVYRHPDFDNWNIDYDISVLRLERNLIFNNKIGKVNMNKFNEDIPAGTQCTVTGWGFVQESGPVSNILHAVKLPIVEHKVCKDVYGSDAPITDQMICAGLKEGGKGACTGDSGGPLVCNKLLVGLSSWGYGCARPNYPGIYSSIPALRNFVRNVTGLFDN